MNTNVVISYLQATEAVAKVDLVVKYFIDKLREGDLLGCVNLIFLSDHGYY